MKDLSGQLVLLTGASSGLGPVIARRLRRKGVRFVLSARRKPELDALSEELGDSRVIPADLSLPGETERLAAECGPVDVLLANAGIPASGRLDDLDVAQIDRGLQVNLRSPIVLANLLAPGMVERHRGHLLFMSSIAGKMPTPGFSIYNATKFGLRGFAHALRQELRGTGVGVSVVCPTFVTGDGMFAETGLKAHPMAGAVPSEAVAEAVLTAIIRNRAEIDVAPMSTLAGLKMAAVAPRFAESVMRRAGAASMGVELAAKQRHKR